MRARALVVFGLAGMGCHNDQGLAPAEVVSLSITSPTYGQFLGEGPIEVQGKVTPAVAYVKVEGEPVDVSADGTFTASLPFEKRYRVVDVEATAGNTYTRARVPVFDGQDPVETWPGAITVRLTPAGLERLGEMMGETIDASGWDATVAASMPPLDLGGLALTPAGITHDPTVVKLLPAIEGLDAAVSLQNVVAHYDLTVDFFGTVYTDTVSIGFGNVDIGAVALPELDADGMVSLTLTDPSIDFGEPIVELGSLDGWLLELVVGGISDYLVEPLGDLMLDAVLSSYGSIDLGGPYEFGTDLMGTPIEIALADVYGDPAGLAMGLGVGLGEDAPQTIAIPAPVGRDEADIHAAIGLHEGLLQSMLGSQIDDLLSQDIVLEGSLGELIGAGVRNLPGGETAPMSDGWCLTLKPQPARVARLQDGIDPLAVLYLPDLEVDISTLQLGVCEPWLVASVATEVGIAVDEDGHTIGIDMNFAEGAILSYGATSDWNEQEVVDGLLGFLQGAMGLMGGMLEFDIADFTGGMGSGESGDPLSGAFGEISPRIRYSEPLVWPDGSTSDGLYSVGLQLWE